MREQFALSVMDSCSRFAVRDVRVAWSGTATPAKLLLALQKSNGASVQGVVAADHLYITGINSSF